MLNRNLLCFNDTRCNKNHLATLHEILHVRVIHLMLKPEQASEGYKVEDRSIVFQQVRHFVCMLQPRRLSILFA